MQHSCHFLKTLENPKYPPFSLLVPSLIRYCFVCFLLHPQPFTWYFSYNKKPLTAWQPPEELALLSFCSMFFLSALDHCSDKCGNILGPEPCVESCHHGKSGTMIRGHKIRVPVRQRINGLLLLFASAKPDVNRHKIPAINPATDLRDQFRDQFRAHFLLNFILATPSKIKCPSSLFLTIPKDRNSCIFYGGLPLKRDLRLMNPRPS